MFAFGETQSGQNSETIRMLEDELAKTRVDLSETNRVSDEEVVCAAVLARAYGAPLVKILYLTDLAQKLLSLRIFSYLCAEMAISTRI